MNKLSRYTFPVLALLLAASPSVGQMAKRRAWANQDSSLPTETGTSFDSTVDKKEIKVRRVAIIPNRMPLFLTEADMWRRYNWQLLAGMFEDRGFDVVDYDSTAEAFTRANLPMEDTGASEEKFASMARILQADLLVMPYYGTSFQSKMVLVANVPSYIALVTLQIYAPSTNKFIYRSDQTGKTTLFMGYSMLGLLISLPLPATTGGTDPSYDYATGTYDAGTPATANPAKILLPILGVGIDLGLAMIPPKRHWERAFVKADRQALQPFFASFPGPMGAGGRKKKVVKRVPVKAVEEDAGEDAKPVPTKAAPAKTLPSGSKAAPAAAPAAPAAPADKAEKKDEEDLGLGVDE